MEIFETIWNNAFLAYPDIKNNVRIKHEIKKVYDNYLHNKADLLRIIHYPEPNSNHIGIDVEYAYRDTTLSIQMNFDYGDHYPPDIPYSINFDYY